VEPVHDHAPEGRCLPRCPAWESGVLALYTLQRRYAEMLEACRIASAIEFVKVATSAPGVKLPAELMGEDLVRLPLVEGRDCQELSLDEWGIHAGVTFRGRRFDCAFPWHSVLDGGLRAPDRKRRFGVIQGGKKD